MSNSKGDKIISPKFIVDPNLTSKRVYSNFANVKRTGVDFTLAFGDINPPTKAQVEKAKKGEEINIPLQCEIVLPNELIPSLINALQSQYDLYLKGISNNKDKKGMEDNKPKR